MHPFEVAKRGYTPVVYMSRACKTWWGILWAMHAKEFLNIAVLCNGTGFRIAARASILRQYATKNTQTVAFSSRWS